MEQETEHGRVEAIAAWYSNEQLDFDKRMIRFRYESIRPHFVGPRGLEMGPADGQMTRFLLNDFEELTLVEGVQALLDQIPDHPSIVKVRSLFEEYEPERTFDTLVMDHILEHVEEPVPLLERAREWVSAEGRLVVGVPNGDSIHRLAAVKMGMLEHQCDLNDRDRALGHRRVYTPSTLRDALESAGLIVDVIGGTYFKPVSGQQIQDTWTEDMIRGFRDLGKDFPENAAEIYAVCRPG